MSLFRPAVLLTLFCFAAPLSSQAVVVAGGDGSQNATAPLDDFGFGNVAQLFSPTDGFFESCVYLEGNWILTAYHTIRDATATGFSLGQVIFHDPVLGAVVYDPIQGSGIRLRNADNTFTDLALFQIAGIPEFLDKVTISEEPPPVNGTLYMAGNGIPRESTLTQWDVNTSTTPDTWTQVASGGDQSGYELLATTSAIRWGTNTVENNAPLPIIQQQPTVGINGGYGSVTAIKTDFDNVSGQAQGVAGDSGGGVFYKRGTWELTGIMVTRDYKDGQTGIGVDSAVFGNATYSANLSTYRQQIVNTIPEPSTAGLLIAGAASLLTGRRRRK